MQLHGIDVDEQGIRLDMLENFILDNRPKLIYVMPTFQTRRVQSCRCIVVGNC